jgi:hypothetical protein
VDVDNHGLPKLEVPTGTIILVQGTEKLPHDESKVHRTLEV